ncbi:hypothetical protein ABFV50_32535, partial [Bacillus cereus]
MIQKYESFVMEPNESIEEMFSRFQLLVAGIRPLNKSYITADHVMRILRGLPESWMPLITSLELTRDVDQMSLEELISILKCYELKRAEHQDQKKKSIALKSKSEKAKALQAEDDESDEASEDSDEDELTLISRRLNRIWKHR